MVVGRHPERRGVYPGSFDPPTVAHVAISVAAIEHHGLANLTWMVSTTALGKETANHPPMAERLEVLAAGAADVPGLEVAVTDAQLLADIAEDFDLVVMGADKWHQIHEERWYDDERHRRATLTRLPTAAIVARAGSAGIPDELRLPLDDRFADVSSTRARAGEVDLMAPAARAHALRTGRWLA